MNRLKARFLLWVIKRLERLTPYLELCPVESCGYECHSDRSDEIDRLLSTHMEMEH